MSDERLTDNEKYKKPKLVFSRGKNDRVWIIPKNDKNYKEKAVAITIISVRENVVRVGINASPEYYLIHRQEVLEDVEKKSELEKQLGLSGEGI